MNKKKNKVTDAGLAAANDKTQEVEPNGDIPFNEDLKKGVESVMGKIKNRKKSLPNIVTTEERVTVSVRYEFSETELKKISKEDSQLHFELTELEEEKKSVMAQFKERAQAKIARRGICCRQIRDGFENRDHQAILILDFKKKERRYKDVESKKIVKAEPFIGDEQRRFL